jgi:hypothetical protein
MSTIANGTSTMKIRGDPMPFVHDAEDEESLLKTFAKIAKLVDTSSFE